MPTHQYDAIAIDGPAASGKSTVARELAARLELIMVNSGEMYRAVTLEVVRRGVDPGDPAAVVGVLREIDLHCAVENRNSMVLIAGCCPNHWFQADVKAIPAHSKSWCDGSLNAKRVI